MKGTQSDDLRRRARLLLTVLAVIHTRFPDGHEPRVVGALREWLDSWPGIGRVVVGMARQGYDLQLTRYGEQGWRGTFYPAGTAHSVTSAVGSVFAATPWHAVQGAAVVTRQSRTPRVETQRTANSPGPMRLAGLLQRRLAVEEVHRSL